MKHSGLFRILPLISLLVLLLAGCGVRVVTGSRDHLVGETYPEAERYQTGSFTYAAEEIQAVEVYWRSGEVELIESEQAELKVSESGTLSGESAMHYLLDNGTLRIRFCGSGARITVDPDEKRLTLEVPRGIALSIHGTAAPITAESLDQQSILISSHSGSIGLGQIKAETVDLSSSAGSIRAEGVQAQSLQCGASSGSVRLAGVAAEELKLKTSSGSVRLALTAPTQAAIITGSGGVTLSLPRGGAQLSYTSGSGSLRSGVAFQRLGDLYVFGEGESSITVESSSGSLEIAE